MLIAINVILYYVSSALITLPFAYTAKRKCSVKTIAIRYCLFLFGLGTIKLLAPINSDFELIMILINNIALIVFTLSISEKGGSKILLCYVIIWCDAITSNFIIVLCGIDNSATLETLDYTYGYVIEVIVSIFINAIAFFIMKKSTESFEGKNIDKLTISVFCSQMVYLMISQAYIFGLRDFHEMKEDSIFFWSFILIYVFVEIMVVVILLKNIFFVIKEKIRVNELIKEEEKHKYEYIIENNNRIAKLRHDYINQLNIVKNIGINDPEKAMEIMDKLVSLYERELQVKEGDNSIC